MAHPKAWKPSKEQLLAANNTTIPDLIALNLDVLFCGINPGLYSGATGHHFARPGNRFWPALHAGGFTPRVVSPFEEEVLLEHGCGITNFVDRTTAAAAELGDHEFCESVERLKRKVLKYKPKFFAALGIGAYRVAFNQPKAKLGRQELMIGKTHVWVLPNPSGLNAHHTPASLGKLFRELKNAIDES